VGETIENSGTVLVTGAKGYIGGRLFKYLKSVGVPVLGTTSRDLSSLGLLLNDDLVTLNLLNPLDCMKATDSIQAVVHLASLNEIDCEQNPQRAIEVNGIGTLNLLNAAIRNKVQKFVYFSTAHVYGALNGIISEDTPPRATHPYSYSHLLGEDVLRSICKSASIDGVTLRLSNAIGAPASPDVNRWTLLVNDLCQQAVRTRRLILQTAGLQHRDFIGLSDVCRATHHVLKAHFFDGMKGEIFNLGGSRSLTIFEVASIISKRSEAILGYPVTLEVPKSHPNEKTPSGAKLEYSSDKFRQSDFVWTSNLESEIDETLVFCKQHFS
jgi:UDP-glucose 4-epimerase